MIRSTFKKSGGRFISFSVSGHSGYGDSGSDIVCAGVSSAVMLICNAITEVFKIKADVAVKKDEISLKLIDKSEEGGALIESLALHLNSLREDYPENITTDISEV